MATCWCLLFENRLIQKTIYTEAVLLVAERRL